MPRGIYERTETHIKNMSISRIGRKVTEDHRKKIISSLVGRKHSKETRKKISESISKERNHNWKGGRQRHSCGYIVILNPRRNQGDSRKYVLEHRLVVEDHIGRHLKPSEVVHHIGERDDNRPHMLIAFTSKSAHHRFHKDPSNVKPEEIIFDGRTLAC